MLNIRYITQNTKLVVKKLQYRNFPDAEHVIAQVLHHNAARKKAQTTADHLAANLKEISHHIGQQLKAGNAKTAEGLKQEIAYKKQAYAKALQHVKQHQEILHNLLISIPNLPDDEVPIGKNATENKVIYTWQPNTPTKAILPHWELAKKYHLIDFALGSKITGTGFPVYQGKGAKLQRSLLQFFLEEAIQAGYYERNLPIVTNSCSAFATGQLPDKEGMMYALQEEGMYLIPTAEVPLTNLYRDMLLEEHVLPIKEVAYTPCFRREAGSWGRHVRGLNRLHQFDKVEIVQIVAPEQAREALQSMCTHVQSLLEKLELPYRMVQLCTGDLSFTSAITHDFEVWSAGQQQWLEVSSVSCFTTYQTKRLELRYKKKGQKTYCYTLNGSALALPRIMAALLENQQSPEGISIPKALHSYTGFSFIAQNSTPP